MHRYAIRKSTITPIRKCNEHDVSYLNNEITVCSVFISNIDAYCRTRNNS